jgi:hypothetical protein
VNLIRKSRKGSNGKEERIKISSAMTMTDLLRVRAYGRRSPDLREAGDGFLELGKLLVRHCKMRLTGEMDLGGRE